MERYPHHRYLRYLLSRRMTDGDIKASCLAHGLVAPDDLDDIRVSLGSFPKSWRSTLGSRSAKFRKWLDVHGVLDLWEDDETTRAAKMFLYKGEVRRAFEATLLAHGDPSLARSELLARFHEATVPPLDALIRYQKLFWDVGAVSPDRLFTFLEESQERDTYIPAMRGDLVTVYGQLGLHQKIQGDVFLQNVLEAANQQALRMRRNPDMNGQQLAGVATVIRVGMEARTQLEELHQAVNGDSSLREEASVFMARSIRGKGIVAFDDLDGDVLEADYAVGESNVRRLPKRP